MLEKTLESSLDCKEIQPVHPKGDQSWVFIGRTDVEAETPILWPPDAKIWLIGKDPDAGKDWGQKEKGTTEDETVGWHHRLNGHGFGWTPGIGDGQGGLVCCSSCCCKESDMTEWLNWIELNWCWDMFPLYLLWWEFFIVNRCWILLNAFFNVSWDDNVIFILPFVNVVYHTDWFAYTKESLHPWDKSHLIMCMFILMYSV